MARSDDDDARSDGRRLVDGERRFTYAELDRLTDNLALNLLELGFKPLDRVVPTLPNVAEFVILYFALQKIGCIPIAALAITLALWMLRHRSRAPLAAWLYFCGTLLPMLGFFNVRK